MSLQKTKYWNSFGQMLRVLLVGVVVVFISLLSPNNARFQYEFSLGQRWHHSDLKAPFSFPILKSESELKEELEYISEDFSPYYVLDNTVLPNVLSRFQKQFSNQLNLANKQDQYEHVRRFPDVYKDFSTDLLKSLYEKGICALEEVHIEKGNEFVINVQRGNEVYRQTVNNIKSIKKAQQQLDRALAGNELKDSEFLIFALEDLIQANVFYDDSLTLKQRNALLADVPANKGMVNKDDVIISKGEVVTPEVFQSLVSFKKAYEGQISSQRTPWVIFGGFFLLTLLVLGVFLMYLQNYYPSILRSLPQMVFILMWFVIFGYLVFAVEKNGALSIYMLPFCIVPIIVKIFYTDRLAIFTHVSVVLIASYLSSLGYEFIFLQILAGIIAVLSIDDIRNWSKFFISMLFIFLTYTFAIIGLMLIVEGNFIGLEWNVIGWLFLGTLFTMLALPLIPLIARVFGFVTPLTLVELSDMNRPLLQELALKAPGTLQHSLQVGNLSESAARAIGADALLVKVAALYHDIGKTLKPSYFIENQSGVNPHDELSFVESAQIIVDHVRDGAELAKKYRLPSKIIDFIWTHHGTTRVEYFYRNYKNANPDKEVDVKLFTYPGPKPTSLEQTILLLADSIEAASKSLKNATGEDIDNLVDKISNHKLSLGQLDESEMTFQQFEICLNVFKRQLRSMLHVRIEYPEEK